MRTSSAYFTTNDGVRLHYLEAGRGRPLVLLPGWTQPAGGFSKQLAALSDSFRCLALDFRGHGESDRPSYGYRVARLARDCLDFLDHLRLDDAVLLGHSAGCVVIWSFIDLFGEDRVRALVLCDEPITFLKRPGWSETECREYGASLEAGDALAQAAAIAGPDGERVLRDFLSHEFSPEFPGSEVESVIESSLRMPRSAAAELMLSVMQADFRDLLPRIRRPALCIGGSRSHLGPRAMPWIASRIPGAQLAMIDARHFVHLENPEAFNSIVRAFLEGLDAATPTSQPSGAPNDTVFHSHRVLPHQPQSVFEAFARPELLARWWGPSGFTNTFEIFEFLPGGRWKFVMHGPDGSHHPNESVFVELRAPSKLVIQHVSQPRFVLTITLAAHETGTAIAWVQEFEDGAVAARIRHIVEPANEQNLDRLVSVLAGGHP